MSFLKSLSSVAVLAAATSAANAALTLNWVEVTIPATAQTTGNPTVNGKLPAGDWSTWELRATFTAGDKFGGGALRATLPAGAGFYRQTIEDPDEIAPAINFDLTRLLPGTSSNPARGLSTGVSYPGGITGTAVLGALRADGSQGPASESVAPDGTNGTDGSDGLLSIVWGNVTQAPTADGTFAVARLTANVPLGLAGEFNVIGQGSVTNRLSGGGVPIPSLFVIPEPTMGFALAGLGLLGLRRRK